MIRKLPDSYWRISLSLRHRAEIRLSERKQDQMNKKIEKVPSQYCITVNRTVMRLSI